MFYRLHHNNSSKVIELRIVYHLSCTTNQTSNNATYELWCTESQRETNAPTNASSDFVIRLLDLKIDY